MDFGSRSSTPLLEGGPDQGLSLSVESLEGTLRQKGSCFPKNYDNVGGTGSLTSLVGFLSRFYTWAESWRWFRVFLD